MTGIGKPGKIFEAMINVSKAIGHVGKDSTNTHQGFKFRSIDQLYNILHQHLAECGVFTTTRVLPKYSKTEERTTRSGAVQIYRIYYFKFTFYTIDGSKVSSIIPGEASDTGDKASNKAMSIAQKYAFIQAFSIPTEEAKDPDADSHEAASKDSNQLRYESEEVPPPPPPAPKKQTPYTGTDAQQNAVKELLKKRNIAEEYWLHIHEKLMGKPSSELNNVIREVCFPGLEGA